MHFLVQPGERVFILLTSGSLSLSQSIMTLVKRDFDNGLGLAQAASLYDAARSIGQHVRAMAEIDRAALERDDIQFNVHFILGGQIKGQPPDLYLIYPQGNPMRACEESPFLQIGESKYGRPILLRGIRHEESSLEEAAKYALISIDSTMRSNVSVGPPIDIVLYDRDDLQIKRFRRLTETDADLREVHALWEKALREAVQKLPELTWDERI
jgi:putative proteasome-type protease